MALTVGTNNRNMGFKAPPSVSGKVYKPPPLQQLASSSFTNAQAASARKYDWQQQQEAEEIERNFARENSVANLAAAAQRKMQWENEQRAMEIERAAGRTNAAQTLRNIVASRNAPAPAPVAAAPRNYGGGTNYGGGGGGGYGGGGGSGGGEAAPEAVSIAPVAAAPVRPTNEANALPAYQPPPPLPAEVAAGGEAGGVGTGVSAEGRGGIYGNLFQNTNRRNPRQSLSLTSDELRKSAASRLGL